MKQKYLSIIIFVAFFLAFGGPDGFMIAGMASRNITGERREREIKMAVFYVYEVSPYGSPMRRFILVPCEPGEGRL